ncbi:MAG: hypothetical protein OWR52_06180 [Acidibacillus sp.]|nr:hypothetical protein [Acidibacillus sp.]
MNAIKELESHISMLKLRMTSTASHAEFLDYENRYLRALREYQWRKQDEKLFNRYDRNPSGEVPDEIEAVPPY